MGVVEHQHFNLDERFILPSKGRNTLLAFIVVGLVLFVLGIFMLANGSHGEAHHAMASASEHATTAAHSHDAVEAHGKAIDAGHGLGEEHGFNWISRVWATLWINNVFFTGVSLIGLFFVAYNYVAWAGWSASLIRVPMAMPSFLPITFIFGAIIFALGHHDLFHWTHEGIMEKGNPHYDKIIAGKEGYLNLGFFIGRSIFYFGSWILMHRFIVKQSALEDINGGTEHHNKMIVLSAFFLIIFGISSSMSAWDWVMSIDTHWFSTMFGWYVLASWHVSGIACITLIVLFLKDAGYLKMVNENHLHDLGKFMFAFTIFWTYIWFSQFILIFYANITEETTYFMDRLWRFDNLYTGFFIVNILINFVFPFLGLMTRESKRQVLMLKIVAIAILFGHWLDFFLMITPGTLKGNGGFGFLEIGSILFFIGLFGFVVAKALEKNPLIAKNHPYLEESIHHNI